MTHLYLNAVFNGQPTRFVRIVDFVPRVGDFVVVDHKPVKIKLRVDTVEWSLPQQHGDETLCVATLGTDHIITDAETQTLEKGWAWLP